MRLIRNARVRRGSARPAVRGPRRLFGSRRSLRPPRPLALVLTVLLLLAGGAACAARDGSLPGTGDGDDMAGLGRLKGQARGPVQQPQAPAAPAAPAAPKLKQTPEQRLAAAQRWGLDQAPLEAPPPPKEKPRLSTPEWADQGDGLIPAPARVPTDRKIAFLTIDDGAAKDREFLEMVRDLQVPLSAFLTDESAAEDYGYFRDLHALGVSIQNHTLHHPQMNHISEDEQYTEICGQQDILEREIGARPTLFRPPYGDFDADTLAVAEECGARAAPLWNEEAFADRMDFRHDDQQFHPGDIILTHFNGPKAWGGTMCDMLRTVLRKVTEQGYALARLEDYA
ncbi:polysaccharide deacetylase family protein [Streptomyces sp. NPDC008001]|uniref:polysaccharide deacetylase family protein n=1 Tax=Streptomyces sp. NPDC008001 TaxID=3364804 RepID=UPI0036E2DD4C